MNTAWNHLNLSPMRIYEGPPRTNSQSLCKTNLFLSAWYIRKGHVCLKQESTVIEAGEGNWVFPRVAPRFQQFAQGSLIYSVAVNAEWPDGRPLFDHGLPAVIPGHEALNLIRICKQLLQLVELPESLDQHLTIRATICKWLQSLHDVFISRGIIPDEEAFRENGRTTILNTLNRWPLDHPYSAAELGRRLGFSKTHSERLCVRALGKTPKRFLDEKRVAHALNVLRIKSVKEVASEVGFSHASTFSAWFKKNAGISPRELKASSRTG